MPALSRLHALVRTLRGPGGCAWDAAQTPATLRTHLIAEAHEVGHAIAQGTPEALRDELGDLLFVTLSVAEAAGAPLDAIETQICAKMVRRHPHVFGDADEAPDWRAVKAAERDPDASALGAVSDSLPSILRAEAITQAASDVGFDWPDRQGVRDKLDEEIAELDAALLEGDAEAIADELGDVLFTVVNLSRFLPAHADDALAAACAKFERRFRAMEKMCVADGTSVNTLDGDALESLWARAKEIT